VALWPAAISPSGWLVSPPARAAERALVVRSAIINNVAINPHGETLALLGADPERPWRLAATGGLEPLAGLPVGSARRPS